MGLQDRAATASIRQQVVPLTKASGRGREGRIVDRTKGGDARVIELDARTVRPDGKPFHPEVFSKTFDRRVRQEGFSDLPVIRLHDLRHTWATLALKAGVEVKVVSERLGHSSPVITWTIYQHVVKGMQTDAAEKVSAMIFGAPIA